MFQELSRQWQSVVSSWGEKHQCRDIRDNLQKCDFIKIIIYIENMTHGLVFVFFHAAALFLSRYVFITFSYTCTCLCVYHSAALFLSDLDTG